MTRSRLAAWICFCLVLGTAARPAGAYAPQIRAPQRVLLPNCVHLILKPEASTDGIAITAIVRMPEDTSRLDAATGELVARALFFGSMNSPFESVARAVAQVGGDLETLRTPDYVAITCVTVREQLDQAIYLLCEALKNAEFPPEALERARHSFAKDQRHQAADPFEAAYESACSPLRGVFAPDPDLFRHVTQERALTYFKQRYVPNRTVVAVVGQFDPRRVEAAFENEMIDYTRQPASRPPFPPTPRTITATSPAIRRTITGQMAFAAVGLNAPSVRSPDFPAYLVLQAILGSGHASRLFRRIRDGMGFGYEVGTAFQAYRGDPMVAYLEWDGRRDLPSAAASVDGVLQILNAQIDGVLLDPPSDAEIARARNVTIGRDAIRHERVRDRAFHLAWYEGMELGYTFDTELPRLIASVTRNDVLRVARTYLSARTAALAIPTRN